MPKITITNQHEANLTEVELANTATLRLRGLLGRKALTMQQGLLILPCNSVHTFGMKFPIDVVYLNKKNQVIKIVDALKPTRMSGCLRASKVLELASGSAQINSIKKGDTLSW